MRSEVMQVEMAGERSKGRGGGGLLYPLTQKIAITALRPRVSGVNPETPGSPETPW
jgi:hypothetical protein